MPQVTPEELENLFTYHAPKGDQNERYMAIRNAGRKLAETIIRNTRASPEQTLAIREVQAAVMWANACIATNE